MLIRKRRADVLRQRLLVFSYYWGLKNISDTGGLMLIYGGKTLSRPKQSYLMTAAVGLYIPSVCRLSPMTSCSVKLIHFIPILVRYANAS